MSLRRPILKCLPTAESQPGNPSFRGRVHFPPTPEISATYLAHSAWAYDRSAIVVSPNVCSIPRRHCPDRTYVLSEGKGEARLLKSVQAIDNEDANDTPRTVECDQGAPRMDDFSIPGSPSSTPEMVWSESDDSDELLSSPNEISLKDGHPPIPLLDVTMHDTHTGEASESPAHVQAALAFLPHPLPPALERKRNVSPRDRDRQDRVYSFSGGESSRAPPLPRSRRTRRALSFIADLPPDLGCLGGF